MRAISSEIDVGWCRSLAAQDEHGRGAALDGRARDAEYEISGVHALAELGQLRRRNIAARFHELARPTIEQLVKQRAIRAIEADWLLQDDRAHALGGRGKQRQHEGASNAHTQHVTALDLQLIEQREMVVSVRMPTIRSADRRPRRARVALVHSDHAKLPAELLDGMIRRARQEL